MRNKIILILFLFLLPSILLSQETLSDYSVNIPKNIKVNDILILNINSRDYYDGNCIIDNKSYEIKKFWLAYFNSKENSIMNHEYYEADEFLFNDEKELFKTITKKRYILYTVNMNSQGFEFPEYNFKKSSFIFSDYNMFPTSHLSWYKDCSGKSTRMDYIKTIQPVNIIVSSEKAKYIKTRTGKCNLQLLLQILKPTYISYKTKGWKDECEVFACKIKTPYVQLNVE